MHTDLQPPRVASEFIATVLNSSARVDNAKWLVCFRHDITRFFKKIFAVYHTRRFFVNSPGRLLYTRANKITSFYKKYNVYIISKVIPTVLPIAWIRLPTLGSDVKIECLDSVQR